MADDLSPRERETLEHIAEGRTTKEIAAELSISESTVNWHIANARTKLGASNRAEAVAIAFRRDAQSADQQLDPTERIAPPRDRWLRRGPWLPRLNLLTPVTAVVLLFAGAALAGGAAIVFDRTARDASPAATSRAATAPPTAFASASPRRDISTAAPSSSAAASAGPDATAPADTTAVPPLPPVGPPTAPPLAVPPLAAPPLGAPTLVPTALPLPTVPPLASPPLPLPSVQTLPPAPTVPPLPTLRVPLP